MTVPLDMMNDIRSMDAGGVPRAEIARRLGVSRNTVAKYADMDDMSPAAPAPARRARPDMAHQPHHADAYERQSVVITTNLEFSRWGAVFGDDQMAAAVIDRLVHHGRLVQFRGESYRVRNALMQEG